MVDDRHAAAYFLRKAPAAAGLVLLPNPPGRRELLRQRLPVGARAPADSGRKDGSPLHTAGRLHYSEDIRQHHHTQNVQQER